MKKTDIIIAIITGEGLAWLFIWLIKKSAMEMAFLNWALPVFLPVLVLTGLWFSYLIGKKYLLIFQLAKFVLIGALFALFDLVILNSLMGYFGITVGIGYSVFVTISFVIITTVKYVADKYWAFEKTEGKQIGMEFAGFFVVTLISGVIHIGVASLIVNIVGPLFGISALLWANLGKILGILVASAWNFIGYKFLVFKK